MENRLEPPQSAPPQSSPPSSLVQILEARPLMFWGGMWVSLLLVAAVSVSSLVSPGLTGGQAATGAAIGAPGKSSNVAAQPAIQPDAQTKNSFPLWLFGAIAFSCTAGSILVSKQLRPQRRRTHRPLPPQQNLVRPSQSPTAIRQPTKPVKQPAKPIAAVQQPARPVKPKPIAAVQSRPPQPPAQRRSQPQAKRLKPAPKPPVRQPKRQSALPAQAVARRSRPRPTSARPPARVPVAVVPTATSHPLDWQAASVADAMDIRKQRSLSSWL